MSPDGKRVKLHVLLPLLGLSAAMVTFTASGPRWPNNLTRSQGA